MPGPKAYRPGDIVTTYGGKTVEVLNTDAEGRIVLADALAYAEKQFRPSLMIDFATLTGACVVALGHQRAGLFTEETALRETLWQLGTETGDLVWPLPLGEEFDELIKSDIALAKNTGGRWGGACTAASFLKMWVEKTPWIHFDIAGPAWTTKDQPHLEKGATGFGVRLITEFLRQRSI
jgi:leucyl aminopeptidase